MNRRAFIKHLSTVPIALATLFTRPLVASVVREEEDEELGQEEEEIKFGIPYYFDLGPTSNNWASWYVFDKGISQKKQEKILKALRMELKNHKFQNNI